ncbi:VOC family protein [Thalassospira marina]|uniref:Glyoxalase/bleomycin resistance/extradiol dioxygenase family protein n=1 Tax=Thalassospira marina TaxID=2048283 RepID=A0A2N3KTP5_9PROT|nr:VOC family protein [Thalassospira marina]PKR53912.1 glyoxalase/bleomycin resistance/extradiol dioxygenase family protein [Thalassospira marina]
MAHIEHVALWTRDLSASAEFWQHYFGAQLSPVYSSQNRPGYQSIFVSLEKDTRIELMTGPWVHQIQEFEFEGWSHIAISLGSELAVNDKAVELARAGFDVKGPRHTGDGYYEAVFIAPGNILVEILV